MTDRPSAAADACRALRALACAIMLVPCACGLDVSGLNPVVDPGPPDGLDGRSVPDAAPETTADPGEAAAPSTQAVDAASGAPAQTAVDAGAPGSALEASVGPPLPPSQADATPSVLPAMQAPGANGGGPDEGRTDGSAAGNGNGNGRGNGPGGHG